MDYELEIYKLVFGHGPHPAAVAYAHPLVPLYMRLYFRYQDNVFRQGMDKQSAFEDAAKYRLRIVSEQSSACFVPHSSTEGAPVSSPAQTTEN